jgi:two-component system sensor histidine kinase/response regulator
MGRAVADGGAAGGDAKPRPRVLLVDDRPDNLLALTAVLEQLDVELVPVRSGEEALRRLLGEEFALIILDVQMPVLDGFETARLIKQRERTRWIPIIFLTAISGEPEHYARGYATGAVDYVFKPFSPEILRAKVAVFVELWGRGATIERQAAELRRSLDELDNANDRLAKQAGELERSNSALERFAEIAAHELRRPLHNVAGFLDLLLARHRDDLDEEAVLLVERAAAGAAEARALTGALLDYARTGSEPLKSAPVPLGEALDAARARLAPALDASGAVVTAGPLPTVPGDLGLLTQLLVNLLDNAVKFRSDAPPAVEVTAEPADDTWRVRVRDNGIGIDPTDAPRLFTVFARLHPSGERPGHGVGLAVCRRIVERHGGAIWCEPAPAGARAPGGPGASFVFTLPMEPP